ncbi:MAG: glycosyltransferase family 39 protein [Elusimicrobia bacterium]|nr:glycosyltransferase family 39 protein [Elusimicrobiota bacterium]
MRSERRFFVGVALLALAARVAALLVWEAAGLSERLGYDPYPYYAKVLLGWLPPAPVIIHPPVYSFWVAGVFAAVRAPSHLAVQCVNVVLGTAAVLLFALWARRVLPSTASRVAALWLALDPLLGYFSVQLQSEPLFMVLLGVFVLGLDAAGDPLSPKRGFALGVLGGVMSLTRSVTLFYPAFLAGAVVWARRSLRGWPAWLLLAAGWGAAPALWGVRNVVKHGQFIPIATNGGWTLWEGFTLDREEVRRRPYDMREEVERLGLADPADFNKVGVYYLQKTKDFVRAEPLAALRIVVGKAFLFWRPWVYDPYPPAARWAAGLYFSALFVLALVGAWEARGDPRWAPVWGLMANLTALHAVFFTSLRYRTPLEPFLVCLAALGLCRLTGRAAAAE